MRKEKSLIQCVSSVSVPLEFADLCKEVLLYVGIYSVSTNTILSSHTHQHADCSYLIYQPQMAAVNEEFPPQLNSYAMHWKRLACRKGMETWKLNSHREINQRSTLQSPPALWPFTVTHTKYTTFTSRIFLRLQFYYPQWASPPSSDLPSSTRGHKPSVLGSKCSAEDRKYRTPTPWYSKLTTNTQCGEKVQEGGKETEHLMKSKYRMTSDHLLQLFSHPFFLTLPLYFHHCETFKCVNLIKQVCGALSLMPRPVTRGVSHQAKNAEPAASHAH